MSMTLAQMRVRVLRRMDADSGTTDNRWDTTAGITGELDQALGHVFRKEWKRILNACPTFRVQLIQPTTDATGRVTFASLTTSASADAGKNAYRIVQLSRSGYIYSEVDMKDWVISESTNPSARVYWREGEELMLLPKEVSTALNGSGDGFWVSYYPTTPESLSTSTATVDFPNGYEEIVALETAALLLAKGGAETETTSYFKTLAEEMRADMLQDLARTSGRPVRMRYEDSASIWGG